MRGKGEVSEGWVGKRANKGPATRPAARASRTTSTRDAQQPQGWLGGGNAGHGPTTDNPRGRVTFSATTPTGTATPHQRREPFRLYQRADSAASRLRAAQPARRRERGQPTNGQTSSRRTHQWAYSAPSPLRGGTASPQRRGGTHQRGSGFKAYSPTGALLPPAAAADLLQLIGKGGTCFLFLSAGRRSSW